MNRAPSSRPSPPPGEKVPPRLRGRLRGLQLRFMAGEQVRMEQGTSQEPPSLSELRRAGRGQRIARCKLSVERWEFDLRCLFGELPKKSGRRRTGAASPPWLRLIAALAALLSPGCDRPAPPTPAELPLSSPPPTITTAGGTQLVRIPGGQFIMGDDHGEEDEKPAHLVTVSPFCMDTTEVTQQTYQSLMQQNPSKSKDPAKPVEQVDWYHAVLFCNMRSLKEGLEPCYDANTLACDFTANGYRLPTEAEWEHACRAGTQTPFSFGNNRAKLPEVAWFKNNASQTTHPVAQKPPNPWGLYDMHGNVAEWCHDIYGDRFYHEKEPSDPHGPATGDTRVLRGGSWRTSADGCRSSARNSETPRFADACFGSDAYGFRCVRRIEAE